MQYQPEVKKDLLKVTIVIAIFALGLIALKMYDAKTGEVAKIGAKILDTYIK